MRYPRDHKEKSRQKIISVASKEFRRRGIAAFGVGDAMRGAGLTQGAFYGHFSSKEELVREALHEAMNASPVLQEEGKAESLEDLVNHYLEVAHRDRPENGCPFPSLVEEVARHPRKTRESFAADLQKLLSLIESHLKNITSTPARQKKALAMFSTMLGAIQLSRVTASSGLSEKILEAAKEAILSLAREC